MSELAIPVDVHGNDVSLALINQKLDAVCAAQILLADQVDFIVNVLKAITAVAAKSPLGGALMAAMGDDNHG